MEPGMTNIKDKIKVFIADDHSIVRRGLVQVISDTPDMLVVGEAENGNELLIKVKKLKIDIVVMDLDMPEKSGWDVIVQLQVDFPKIPVIILSVYPEDDYASIFFQAGASAYLNKTSAPEQLVEAIRKVVQGGKFISPSFAEKLAFDLGKDKKIFPHETLSHREFQVFHMIASGKTVKKISEELSLSLPTINTHRSHMMKKMGISSNAELIHYAYKNGILK
jgi:DNA-binding NarL/FixJ family response regulator